MRLELRSKHPHRLTRLENWIPRECKDFEPPASTADKRIFWCLAALLFLLLWVGAAQAQLYVVLQAGYGSLGGDGTITHLEEDSNPQNLPWRVLNEGAVYRAAVGYRRDKWAVELGYGDIGSYTRRIDTDIQAEDTAFEKVLNVKAVDLRLTRFLCQKGRLECYGSLSAAFVPYERITWEGNEKNGDHTQELKDCLAGQRGRLPGELCAWDQWNYTDDTAVLLGGAIGLEYRLNANWSVTTEAYGWAGELEAYGARAGLKFRF
jgi:hypothetical protein